MSRQPAHHAWSPLHDRIAAARRAGGERDGDDGWQHPEDRETEEVATEPAATSFVFVSAKELHARKEAERER